jgi:uncharacterized membrane protein
MTGNPHDSPNIPPDMPTHVRRFARHAFTIWLSGLVLPCLVIVISAFLDWFGVKISAVSPWAVLALLSFAMTLMIFGILVSDRPISSKITLSILTLGIFPCCIVSVVFLMAAILGFSR